MAHAPSRARTLYSAIPWEKTATATCYWCGAAVPAQYMLWTHMSEREEYMALCGVCSRDAQADAEGLREAEKPDQYDVFRVAERPIPPYLRS